MEIREELAQALARAYCKGANAVKAVDATLIKAMVEEVYPIIAKLQSRIKELEGYRANFLWKKEDELSQLMYEFVNAGTEEYRESIFNQIKSLMVKPSVGVEEIEKVIEANISFGMFQGRVTTIGGQKNAAQALLKEFCITRRGEE